MNIKFETIKSFIKKYNKYIVAMISLAIIIYITITYATTKVLFDTDLLWHLKIGKDICKTHTIFLKNTYTWLPATTWSQQEWLFDILLYLITTYGGIVGFYMVHVICQFALLYLSQRYNNYKYPVLYVIIAFLLYKYMPTNLINRPLEFSSYFVIIIIVLYPKTFRLKPLVYFLIGLFLINFHGGSVVMMSVIMVLLFALDIILTILLKTEDIRKYDKKFTLQYLFCLFSFCTSLFINPYGAEQVKLLFSVQSLSTTDSISEWRTFDSSYYIVWFLLIVILYAFGYAVHKHCDKNTLLHIGIMSALCLTMFVSRKSSIVFIYVFIFFGMKYIHEMLDDLINKSRLSKIQITRVISDDMSAMLYITCFVVSILIMYSHIPSMDKFINRSNDYVSPKIIKYLQKEQSEHPNMRILNGYVTGNWLLYNDVKCFVDTRQFPYCAELSNNTALDDLFDLTNLTNYSKNDKFFRKYNFNYVICNSNFKLNNYLQTKSKDWTMVCSDKDKDKDKEIYVWKKIMT